MLSDSTESVRRDIDTAPILRRTLHDDIVGRVRDMIIEGQLPPATRVHEGQLGQALGISRTPLREALKFLASEGLIELVPGRGAIVRKLGPSDIRDMLDVLASLEMLAARLSCQNATQAEIAAIRALHDAMIGFYDQRNRLEYYKLNQAIHAAIVASSGNGFLASTHEGIQSRLRRIRFLGNEDPAKWDGAVAEHVEMIAALERRDGDALAEVLARHVARTWDRVKDVV